MIAPQKLKHGITMRLIRAVRSRHPEDLKAESQKIDECGPAFTAAFFAVAQGRNNPSVYGQMNGEQNVLMHNGS